MSVTSFGVRFSSGLRFVGTRGAVLDDAAGRAELVKWLGLVLMFADHIPRYLGLVFPGWSFLGRACFPCFAIALGAQVGGRGSVASVGLRVLLVGALLCPVFLLVDPVARFDVLVTLGFGVLLVEVMGWSGWARVFGALCCLAGGSCGEYGAAGAVLVCSAAFLCRRSAVARVEVPVCGVIGACAVLCLRAGSLGPLAGALFAFGLLVVGPVVPRVRRWFLWVYCLQWPALVLARSVGG